MHHVPGNHESRWNPDAFETYRRYFGPSGRFEQHGLRVVGLAPMQPSQEPGLFGADSDATTRPARCAATTCRPPCSCTYPLAADNYYVNDTEDTPSTGSPDTGSARSSPTTSTASRSPRSTG